MQNIVVCVEEWVDPLTLVAYEGTAAPKQKEVRRDDGADDIRIGGGSANSNKNNNAELKAELRQAEEEQEPLLAGIIQDIVDELSLFRNPGSNHFLRYITTEDIGKEFREGRKSHRTQKGAGRVADYPAHPCFNPPKRSAADRSPLASACSGNVSF